MSLKTYQKPFWMGLFHALSIVLYCTFISLVWMSITPLLDESIAPMMNLLIMIFVSLLSVAVVAYFIFFEPIKLTIHHHFKQASVLVMSTFGWLFVFLAMIIIAVVTTYHTF